MTKHFPKKLRKGVANHTQWCSICNHPDRKKIEELYMSGISPYTIPKVIDLNATAPEKKKAPPKKVRGEGDTPVEYIARLWTDCIYRHVKAYGADEVRGSASLLYLEKTLDKCASLFVEGVQNLDAKEFISVLKLKLQTEGKLVEKKQTEVLTDKPLQIEVTVNKRMKNLEKRLGIKTEEPKDGKL